MKRSVVLALDKKEEGERHAISSLLAFLFVDEVREGGGEGGGEGGREGGGGGKGGGEGGRGGGKGGRETCLVAIYVSCMLGLSSCLVLSL